jgi:hypothetical protein
MRWQRNPNENVRFVIDQNLQALLEISNGMDVWAKSWYFESLEDADDWTREAVIILTMKQFRRIE